MKKILLFLLFTFTIYSQSNWWYFYDSDVTDISPPATPQNLAAVGGVGEIVLTWDANTDVISRYVLYYNTSNDSTSALKVDSVYSGTETLTHNINAGGYLTYYWLIAVDSSQNRGWYSTVAQDTTLPVIPIIVVVGSAGKITITNTAIIADSLRIYRGASANPTTWVCSIAPNGSYEDASLVAGTVYHYRAKSKTGSTISYAYSSNVSDTAEYTLLAENYKDRVIGDGGTVINIAGVDSALTKLQADTVYTDLILWNSAEFGIKKDANNKVTKLYDISPNKYDAVQADTSLSPKWYADSLNGKSIIKYDGTDYLVITATFTMKSFYAVANYSLAAFNSYDGMFDDSNDDPFGVLGRSAGTPIYGAVGTIFEKEWWFNGVYRELGGGGDAEFAPITTTKIMAGIRDNALQIGNALIGQQGTDVSRRWRGNIVDLEAHSTVHSAYSRIKRETEYDRRYNLIP